MIINNIAIPDKLNLFEKPWEIPHLDTLELWKFGDYKHVLKLMCKVLGIPSSKGDIDGSQVPCVLCRKNIDRIVTYCEKIRLL
jgi:hypothetical protein